MSWFPIISWVLCGFQVAALIMQVTFVAKARKCYKAAEELLEFSVTVLDAQINDYLTSEEN